MLAGKLCLTRCHSPPTAGAQARRTLTVLSYVRYSTLYEPSQTRPETHPRKKRFAARYIAARNGENHVIGTRLFSNTCTLGLLPGKREGKYLQPRNRPHFRERSEEEKRAFLRAVQYAQDDYEAEQAQSMDADTTSLQESTPPTSSPFFDASNSEELISAGTIPGQHSTEEVARPPKGFPALTSYNRQDVSTSDLEQELYYIAHNKPYPIAIYNILRILIHDRRFKPGPQHYEALILANCWPEYGSVENVEKILAEMEREGVEIGPSIIVAVLKVLAVHPSAELSHGMLTIAERCWLQLRPQTHHHSILAMLRTGQTELAEWKIDALRMHSRAVHVADRDVIPDYLSVLLMAEMMTKEDWEGVLRYMYKMRNRKASDRELPVEFWGWVLEQAVKAARDVLEQSQHINQSHSQARDSFTWSPIIQEQQPTNPPVSTPPHHQPRTTNPSPTFHHQLSLSNPAKHLTEYIWTLYVDSTSLQPSWTTCLHALHIAAHTGTAWLATSALAVMTYADGVTITGNPKTSISSEIHDLVRLAKHRHEAAKDPAIEEAARQKRLETERKKAEYQFWWTDLMQKLDEKQRRHQRAKTIETSEVKAAVDAEAPDAAIEGSSENSLKDSDATATLNSVGQRVDAAAESSIIDRSDNNAIVPQTQESLPSEHDNPPPLSPTSLWAAFPRFDGVGSARVDAWGALGPRSSSRGKWTEAQEYYRLMETMGKK